MSMLSSQCDELRRKAGRLDRAGVFLVDCEVLLPEGWPKNAMDNASEAMREAADTIESMQDRLQESECDVVKSYGKHPVTNNEVVLYNCSKCGKWIGLSANYCCNCGARIRKVDAYESYGQVPEQEKHDDEGERESYDAGFSNGVKACLQQLDGLILEGADVDEIQAWVDEQWEEEVV